MDSMSILSYSWTSVSPTTHILTPSCINSSPFNITSYVLTSIADIDILNFQNIDIKNFISTHTNSNNFKIINSHNDKIFIIPNKLIIEIKSYENLYLAFIHFTYSLDNQFISHSLEFLNKAITYELTNTHPERLIKLFDKKIVLYSTINSNFSHYYKTGPFPENSKTIYNYSLPNTSSPWFEYTLKLNQYIYNNLSKETQQQKHQEKMALAELSKQSHHHNKSKIKPQNNKKQKTM